MKFSLKSMLIGMAAIAVLFTVWPPYRFEQGPNDEGIGFNKPFWAVLGIEAFIFAIVALTRKADAVRREFDSAMAPDDEELRP